jgi:DNA-binding transcriptional MerR regulator
VTTPVYFNAAQIASRYGVSKSTVAHWVRSGTLEPSAFDTHGVPLFLTEYVRDRVPALMKRPFSVESRDRMLQRWRNARVNGDQPDAGDEPHTEWTGALLDKSMRQEVENLSKTEGIHISEIIRHALAGYLKDRKHE